MIETPHNDPLASVECTEFDCAGCGRHIVSFPPMDPLPTLCGACEVVELIPDPIEREKMRLRLTGGARCR